MRQQVSGSIIPLPGELSVLLLVGDNIPMRCFLFGVQSTSHFVQCNLIPYHKIALRLCEGGVKILRGSLAMYLYSFALVRRRICSCSYSRPFRFCPLIVSAL